MIELLCDALCLLLEAVVTAAVLVIVATAVMLFAMPVIAALVFCVYFIHALLHGIQSVW